MEREAPSPKQPGASGIPITGAAGLGEGSQQAGEGLGGECAMKQEGASLKSDSASLLSCETLGGSEFLNFRRKLVELGKDKGMKEIEALKTFLRIENDFSSLEINRSLPKVLGPPVL